MELLNEVKATSFNQLIKIIKGMVRRRGATLRTEEPGRILCKIKQLEGSISFLMKEHPYHIPVILYHLSSITSELKFPYSQECVNRIPDKLAKNAHNYCKTCKGFCNDIYANFIDIIRDNLVCLSPKGLSQILSIYSECKNPEICRILSELKLRMCYFLYCRCKNMSKMTDLSDIDSIVPQYLSMFGGFETGKLKDDYLNNFINFSEICSENLSKHSSYYLNLNLMDLCVTLESISPSKNIDNNSLYDSNNNNFLDELILKLAFKFLLCHSLGEKGSLEPWKYSDKFELDSVCRLIGLFKRFKCRDQLILPIIVEILNKNMEDLDFRNLVTLLDSFSVISESLYSSNGNNRSGYDSSKNYNRCTSGDTNSIYRGDLISSKYNKIDFKTIVSRIKRLSQVDAPGLLRSLSTVTQVINRISKAVEVPDYEGLIAVVKQALVRYLSNNQSELRNTQTISAIAILLSNVQHPEVIGLLINSLLENLISFDAKNLYDYSSITEVLTKNYPKYTQYLRKNCVGDDNHSHNVHDSTQNNSPNLKNDKVNTSNQQIDFNGNEILCSNCDLNLCKLYSALCLIVSKCSFYYSKLLGDYLRESSLNSTNCLSFSGIPLRELCFFLVNLEAFGRLQVVENEFLKECNANTSNLTRNLERFFMRYHTRICEMDFNQISKYLSQVS